MRPLLILLAIRALLLALLIGFGPVGLAPDEAQYWTWSQDLDWGYYSKPPGIAWQIWLTTLLFGSNPFGIRFGALVIGTLLSVVVYFMAQWAALSRRVSFWAGVVAAFSPLGIYLSYAATTDGGAILFLTLGAALVIKGIEEEKGPHYLKVGLAIFAGALFKWTAFLLWPFVLLYLCFFKNLRKWSLLGGIALSLAALLPSLYWNWTHEWATFRHVGNAVSETKGGNFLDFFAAQIGLLSPLYFLLLVMSYFFLREEKNRGVLFAAGFPCLVLFYLAAAFFKKMQPNWAAYLYPVGFLLIPWVAFTHLKRGKRWLQAGTWLSIVCVVLLFTIPFLQQSLKIPLPYKANPFQQSIGWDKVPEALVQAGFNPQEDFLFADKYQTASLLSFYSPGHKRAYFFNISDTRKNQFSYWPQMEEKEAGRTGFFAVFENTTLPCIGWYAEHYQKRLSPYFEKIEYKGAYPLFTAAGKPVKFAILFRCSNYLGIFPEQTNKY